MSHNPNGLGKSTRSRIHNITGSQIQELLAKLAVLVSHLPLDLPLHELLSSDDYFPGEAAGKHVLQEVSIVGHLRRIGALTGAVERAIELGAGTGRLSDRLQRITQASLDHVMIDRQDFSENQCRDRVLRARLAKISKQDEQQERLIQRVVVDIGSLNLQDYCCGGVVEKKCLCMSKHLCGPACDLTIAAMSRMEKQHPLPSGAIATCCHYLCTWESFAGQAFWKALGLGEDDFVVAVTASQWASLQSTTKSSNNTETPTKKRKVDTDKLVTLPDLKEVALQACMALKADTTPRAFVPSEEFEQNYSREEKVALGIQLKRLLDLARAARLQDLGYSVQLVRYTTRSIEDRLLVVHLPSSKD
jgi:tRNA:m4X modification enzyme